MTPNEHPHVFPAILARALRRRLQAKQPSNILRVAGWEPLGLIWKLTVPSVGRNAILRWRTPHAWTAGLNAHLASGLFFANNPPDMVEIV
jgi:hypothetical protein